MPLCDADLRDIAARAARLDERLAGLVQPSGMIDTACLTARLQRWGCALRVAPCGLPELAARLGQTALDTPGLAALLGPVCWPVDYALPGWVRALDALVKAVQADARMADEASSSQDVDRGPERPFEHVLRPFVRVAQRRLVEQIPAYCLAQLQPGALQDPRRCSAGSADLAVGSCPGSRILDRAPAARMGSGGVLDLAALAGDHTGRQQYARFVKRLLDGGLAGFVREYAVLGRLTTDLLDQWVSATAEFLMRLAQDRTRLNAELLPAAAGPVARIATGLSDPHNGSRCVLVLTCVDGSRVVYKPRDLAVDVAFTNVLDWLGQRGLPLQLRMPHLVNCGSHGWVEFIAPVPCSEAAAVTRFYRRAGQLLALLHGLGAIDCHFENIIAHGEYPVLIDCETVLQPQLAVTAGADGVPGMLTDSIAGHTVLGVGLLPLWALNADGSGLDISGLGGMGEQDTPFRELMWEHVNTDRMVSRLAQVRTVAQANRPLLNGQPVALETQVEALVDGFHAMAALLMAERDDLLAADGPVAALAQASGRFVFRASNFYALLLSKLREPAWLREGIDRSLWIELLAAGLLGRGALASGQMAPLVCHEQQIIEHLNIPRFAVTGDSNDLGLPDGARLVGVFGTSGLERARHTLSSFDAGTVALQVNLIRAALFSRGAEPVTAEAAWPTETALSSLPSTLPLAAADALAAAQALATALAMHAVAERDGSRTWLGLDFGLPRRRITLQPVGIGLYDGVAGIALFLAALARFGGTAEAGDLALAALGAPRRTLAAAVTRAADATLPGADQGMGLGGILYALVYCADWLEQPALLEAALKAVALITPAHIAADRQFDLISGVAGLIPGLLALHRATSDRTALARAVDCGRHLLAHQQPGEAGGKAWPTLGATMLTGFSHGAAGIAYQLVRLATASGDGDFLAAAGEAIAYEQALFDPQVGNWPDLRSSANERFTCQTSWCHGATGIALSHAACLGQLGDAGLLPQIEAGVTATLRAGVSEVDGLCCGNAGRMDTLVSLAEFWRSQRCSRHRSGWQGRPWHAPPRQEPGVTSGSYHGAFFSQRCSRGPLVLGMPCCAWRCQSSYRRSS